MLEVGWTEILVIAIVLIIVVGPKDLPQMLRTFGRMVSKLRGMAGEFRQQFDEALREADLDDVRKTIGDAQKLNPMNAIRDAVNPLRQMGDEIKSDLQKSTSTAPPSTDAEKPADGSTPTDDVGSGPVAGPVPAAPAVPAPPVQAAPVPPVQAAPVSPVQAAPIEPARPAASDAVPPAADASAVKPKTGSKAATGKTAVAKPAVRKTAAAKTPKAASSPEAETAKPLPAKTRTAKKAAVEPAAGATTRKPKKDKA